LRFPVKLPARERKKYAANRDKFDVAADAPARLLQPLQERPDVGLEFRIVRGSGQEYPIRRIRSGCCARAASGHAVAAPPRTAMNSRRFH